MKSVNCSKPGYTSITCSKIEHNPYNLIFTTKCNDSSILITIISCDYLNLSLADEHVGDVTIPTQVIKYNQCCSRLISQSDCGIHIKLNYLVLVFPSGGEIYCMVVKCHLLRYSYIHSCI